MKRTKKNSTNTVLISSSNEFYDDCPVCRLMKRAEKEGRDPTEEELAEAFLKANTQN